MGNSVGIVERHYSKLTATRGRNPCSLRYTYATLELLDGTDIHTLSKQAGNSAAMIERHFSKLLAVMAAVKLAPSVGSNVVLNDIAT